MAEHQTEAKLHQTLLYRADHLVARLIPSFNVRAILYCTVLFALALFLQYWRIAPEEKATTPPVPLTIQHERPH